MGTQHNWHTELHFFADASERAYAACAYTRTIDQHGNITIRLIQAKTRVAPVKAITIPRLELCGSLLATTLFGIIQPTFSDVQDCYFWTDSTTVLRWLGKSPAQLKTFTANRVAEIQEKTTLPNHKWRWLPGQDNPADLASRGISPLELAETYLWWNGPSWLSRPETEWPSQPFSSLGDDDETDSELRPLVHHVLANPDLQHGPWYQHKNPGKPVPLMTTYSNITKLQNTMSHVQRACANFIALATKRPTTIGPLTPEEREKALMNLVQIDQAQNMPKELQHAMETDSERGTTKNGTLIYDTRTGTLRYYGRVSSDNLGYDEKYPIMLAPKGQLAQLMLRAAHQKTLHGGAQQMLQQFTTAQRVSDIA